MSNLQTKLEAIKNKEATSGSVKSHSYVEGDVLKIAGVRQAKGGKEKYILSNRFFVVAGDSKKGDMIRGILLDNNNNLQNCVIALPVDVMTKVGRYTEDGEVVEDAVIVQELIVEDRVENEIEAEVVSEPVVEVKKQRSKKS